MCNSRSPSLSLASIVSGKLKKKLLPNRNVFATVFFLEGMGWWTRFSAQVGNLEKLGKTLVENTTMQSYLLTINFPGSKIVDCGDVPVNPFDNVLAVDQMEVAYSTLLSRPTHAKSGLSTQNLALDGVDHPQIVRF
ncbi:hypothetical protein B0H14DRAFT_3543609 [Mycena olivaceomarginata]|nr:hypothetical protein B0H14DRAFT_3543609 [Mycena olivaceomarginata]